MSMTRGGSARRGRWMDFRGVVRELRERMRGLTIEANLAAEPYRGLGAFHPWDFPELIPHR